MPLPEQVLGEFAGLTYQVYDLLPWTHAVIGLRSVLTYGTGLSPDVIFQMTWLIILTAVLFVVGMVAYYSCAGGLRDNRRVVRLSSEGQHFVQKRLSQSDQPKVLPAGATYRERAESAPLLCCYECTDTHRVFTEKMTKAFYR